MFRAPTAQTVSLSCVITCIVCATCLGVGPKACAAYSDIIDSFETTRGNQFPVAGKTYDDIESAFGTRIQSSSGLYDFHRGIDIDGAQGDDILAPVDGLFWEYREFSGGGHTIILRHDLASTVTYRGDDYDHYYTYYMHLFDDGGGGISGTDDVISGWTPQVTTVNAGDLIGKMGNSGTPPGGGSYADHLHLELRFGFRSSLQFQLENPGNTQYGFDPHMNPMLLFNPYTYATSGSPAYHQNATLNGAANAGDDITFNINYTNDDMPLLNEITVNLKEIGSESTVKTHTLDLNQRIGFDASNTSTLDTADTSAPHFNPITPAFTGGQYKNQLIVPGSWTAGFGTGDHKLEVTLKDLWENSETANFAIVPESNQITALMSILLAGFTIERRRRQR